jgi:hypothetical protein
MHSANGSVAQPMNEYFMHSEYRQTILTLHPHQQQKLHNGLLQPISFVMIVYVVILVYQLSKIFEYCKITYFRWDFIMCFCHIVSLQI